MPLCPARYAIPSLLVALLLGAPAVADPDEIPLGELLDNYARGVEIVYAPALVDGSTQVAPPSDRTLPALRVVLGQLGLAVRVINKNSWLIVASTPDEERAIRVVAGDGAPVAHARVAFGETTTRTDSEGVARVPSSIDAVTVEHAQFERYSGQVRDEIQLRSAVLDNVVITASRYEVSNEHRPSRYRLSQAVVTDTPAVGEDSLRVIHRLPGAASIGVSSRPRVRGGLEDEVLVLFDGIELIDPFHLRDFQSLFSAFNPRSIRSIEYYTGGFPARYGNRMSGVLDIATQDAFAPSGGELGISTFSTSALLLGSKGTSDWLLSARRGNLDLLLDRVNARLGQPRYHDVLLRWGRDLSDSRIEVSAFRFADDIVFTQDENRATSDIDNRYLWVKWTSDDPRYREWVISVSDIDRDRRGWAAEEDRVEGSLLDLGRFRVFSVAYNTDFAPREGRHVAIGGTVRHQTMTYRTVVTATRGAVAGFLAQPAAIDRHFAASFRGIAADAHATVKAELTSRTRVQAGVRLDTQTFRDGAPRFQVSPRMSLSHAARSNLNLRLSVGRFYQPQAIHELRTADGERDFASPQSADHVIAGLELALANGVAATVEAFYKRLRNPKPRYVNLFNPYMLVPEYEPDRLRISATRAYSRGIEVSLGKATDELSWQLNYAIADVRDRVEGRWVPRRFDQTHTVNGVISRSRGPLRLSLAASWHSGWAMTRLAGGFSADTALDVNSVRNRSRLREYASVDLRVNRDWTLPSSSLSFFAQVTNLVNRTNDGGVDYEIAAEDGFALEETDLEPIFPLIASVGIIWRF